MPLDDLEIIRQGIEALQSWAAAMDQRLTDLKHGQAEWLDSHQVAEYLGVSLSTVRGDLRDKLPWKRVGSTKRLIVSRKAVNEYIERQGSIEAEQLLDSADAIKDMIQIRKGRAA
jgi:excisionase family DNA binding protein